MTYRPAADGGERGHQHAVLHRVRIGEDLAAVLASFRTIVIQRRIWHGVIAAGSKKKAYSYAGWVVRVSVLRFCVILTFIGICRILEAEEWASIPRLMHIIQGLASGTLRVVKCIDVQRCCRKSPS